MIVIADTGPINCLILIGEIDVLPALYNRVVVPRSVCDELGRPRAPEVVRATTISRPPGWKSSHRPIRSSSTRFAGGEKRRHLRFTGTWAVLAESASATAKRR